MIPIFSNQMLDSVTPIQLNNKFIIPVNADIKKLFGKNTEFQIYIKENKIIIESPKILADVDSHDNTHSLEALNVS